MRKARHMGTMQALMTSRRRAVQRSIALRLLFIL